MQLYVRLTILLIPLSLMAVLSYLVYRRDKTTKEKNILRFPVLFRIIPLLLFYFAVTASVCILLFHFDDLPLIIIFMGVFGLPGLIMFTAWSLWRVEIKDDGFIYRNYFGKTREYKYEDLEYQARPKGLKWHFYKENKKVVCVAYYIENGELLEKLYRKHMRKLNKQNHEE